MFNQLIKIIENNKKQTITGKPEACLSPKHKDNKVHQHTNNRVNAQTLKKLKDNKIKTKENQIESKREQMQETSHKYIHKYPNQLLHPDMEGQINQMRVVGYETWTNNFLRRIFIKQPN